MKMIRFSGSFPAEAASGKGAETTSAVRRSGEASIPEDRPWQRKGERYITLNSRKIFKYTGCKLCMNKIKCNLDLYDEISHNTAFLYFSKSWPQSLTTTG